MSPSPFSLWKYITKWDGALSKKVTCVPAKLYNKLIFSGASLVNVFQHCWWVQTVWINIKIWITTALNMNQAYLLNLLEEDFLGWRYLINWKWGFFIIDRFTATSLYTPAEIPFIFPYAIAEWGKNSFSNCHFIKRIMLETLRKV